MPQDYGQRMRGCMRQPDSTDERAQCYGGPWQGKQQMPAALPPGTMPLTFQINPIRPSRQADGNVFGDMRRVPDNSEMGKREGTGKPVRVDFQESRRG